MKRLFLILPLALVLLVALVLSQRGARPLVVSGFIESHQARIGSRVGGRVARVLAEEGQAVKAGQALVELEPYDLREKLAQAQAELAAREARLQKLKAGSRAEEIAQARAARDRAQAVLDKLVAGPRPLEIRIAEDRLALAQAEFTKAEKDFDRVRRLREQGQASEEELNDATRAYGVMEAGLAAARNQLALLKEGTRPEELAEQRARVAEAEQTLALLEAGPRPEEIAEAEALAAAGRAAVAASERQIAELTITAPLDGIVEAVELRPGDLVAPSAPVLALSDPSELWVRAYVPENRLNVRTGQPVRVGVDAFPQRRFAAHVTFVARAAEFTPNNVQTPEERSKQVFRIKVVLDEGLDVLRPGMAADVFLEPER